MPKFAAVHSNLGSVLKEQGKLVRERAKEHSRGRETGRGGCYDVTGESEKGGSEMAEVALLHKMKWERDEMGQESREGGCGVRRYICGACS